MIIIQKTETRELITKLKDTVNCKKIEAIHGIRRIELRNHEFDEEIGYKCAQYVFEKEGWGDALSYGGEFWKNAAKFLLDHGYKFIDKPKNNDLVAYGFEYGLKHFGVYKNGKVISKFDVGCVFEHDIELVPDTYGDEAYFMRKL